VQIVLAKAHPQGRDQYQDHTPPTDLRPSVTPDAAAAKAPVPGPAASMVLEDLALPDGEAVSASGAAPAARLTVSRAPTGRIPLAGDLGAWVADEQARLRANRPAGEPTSLDLFGGVPAVGRSFVFLIDRSKSMGHSGLNALRAAEEELLVALEPLQPTHRFQVIAYHHECVYLNRRELLPATEENKQAVRGFLSGLAAFGATEHELALQSALHQKPDAIFLLTDGGDPQLSEAQIRNITRLAAGRTSIHCIQFGFAASPAEAGFLQRLAAANGGGFGYVEMKGAR
jgi:hypothetical protein